MSPTSFAPGTWLLKSRCSRSADGRSDAAVLHGGDFVSAGLAGVQVQLGHHRTAQTRLVTGAAATVRGMT